MATAHHGWALTGLGRGATMTGALLAVQPLPPSVRGATHAPEAISSPEWHNLRLFGRGRHPVNFNAGRERVVEL